MKRFRFESTAWSKRRLRGVNWRASLVSKIEQINPNKLSYQKGVNWGFVRALLASLTELTCVEMNLVGIGSLWVTWELKYLARPNRRFLNSTMFLPDRICVNQCESFPTPFPIRTPLGFLETGRCGKTETQKALLVMSVLREDLFKNSFSRKIFFAEMRRGRRRTRAAVP